MKDLKARDWSFVPLVLVLMFLFIMALSPLGFISGNEKEVSASIIP